MSPPTSTLFNIQDIPNAGRGVVATKPIAADTLLFQSSPPAAHVVFRQYRKEVCAQCFHYDSGRTLPVRHQTTGKVFCTVECEAQWLADQGDVGFEAWEKLNAFVQTKAKIVTNVHSMPALGRKPNERMIQRAWADALDKVNELNTTDLKKQGKTGTVDPDILGFLLSGLLFHFQHPEKWENEILSLAMDERPYRGVSDLMIYCESYVQLAVIMPSSLVADICHTLIAADSHNSFGIRNIADAGEEGGEEYMGYAIYPDASYFNHSCDPNLRKKRVGRVWEFHALRDIAPGEECCISYLGGDEKELKVGERRQRLKDVWRFECGCEKCRIEGGEVKR